MIMKPSLQNKSYDFLWVTNHVDNFIYLLHVMYSEGFDVALNEA